MRYLLKTQGYQHALGAALTLSGLPLAWSLRVWLGRHDDRAFSIGFLIIALVMVVHWGRLIRGRFIISPVVALVPFLFIWPAMLMAWFFGRPDDISGPHLAFVSAFFFALLTIPRHAFLIMPLAFYDVAVIVAILTLGQFMLFGQMVGADDEFSARLFAGDSRNPNYLAFVMGLGIVAAFCEKRHWSGRGLVRWLLWLIGIPLLMVVCVLTGTRSVLLGFGLCIVSVFLRSVIVPRRIKSACFASENNVQETKGAWGLVFAWVAVVIIISAVIGDGVVAALRDSLLTSLDNMVSGTQSGFDVYVAGGFKEVDESAETRAILRARVFSDFNVWGHGYDALYVDAPLLQAFYDFGLLGGLIFVLVALILPLGWWLISVRRSGLSALERFAVFVYIFSLPNLIFHGRPYDFAVWLPVIFLFSVMARRDFGCESAVLAKAKEDHAGTKS